MNEELQKRLLAYMDHLEQYAQQGGDFVAAQAPLVVQEFLAWEFWSNAVLAAAFGVMSVVAVYALVRLVKYSIRAHAAGPMSDFFGEVISPIICISILGLLCGLAIGGYSCAMSALKVHLAPRVYLLEHIAEMVK